MDLAIATTPAEQGPQRKVSKKERALYLAIIEHKRAHDGNSPTLRDMQDACGISSTSVVAFYLRRLAAAGLIELQDGHTRSIRVVGGRWSFDS